MSRTRSVPSSTNDTAPTWMPMVLAGFTAACAVERIRVGPTTVAAIAPVVVVRNLLRETCCAEVFMFITGALKSFGICRVYYRPGEAAEPRQTASLERNGCILIQPALGARRASPSPLAKAERAGERRPIVLNFP